MGIIIIIRSSYWVSMLCELIYLLIIFYLNINDMGEEYDKTV